MRRREFIKGVVASPIAGPLAARAQQPAMPIVAWVHGGLPDANAPHLAAFQKGLSEIGYIGARM
jgi:putative tryptophan/tyrosine transport system substrate-binding protein